MESESAAASLGTEADLEGEYPRAFMVTLCRLSKPVSIQPSVSPQLASFTFFTSRARQPDGSERLYLHMGYFATLSDAQQWSQRLRIRYPNAIATPVPPALLPQSNSDVSALPTVVTRTTPAIQKFPTVTDEPLSDTQVMRILETRHVGPVEDDNGGRARAGVELLRPEDTETRRTLKEAVAAGAQVPFAVQLEWSLQPIDASRVPLLDVFKGYTLYRTEKRRAGRSCYFLRLGFFTDPISAKELAGQVRSTFASAAVVPITEQELLHADEARIDIPAPAGPLHQGTDAMADSDPLAAAGFQTPTATARTGGTGNPAFRKAASAPPGTLEETLEVLAQKEMWAQHDRLSDTGVRHLKITINGPPVRSAQKQRPPIRSA